MTYIILACSAMKLATATPVRADQLYTGRTFRAGLRYAERHGLRVYVLSAKYGLIDPDTLVLPYDQKLRRPYPGPWPEGPGLYLGGNLYFWKAPPCIRPLTPPGLRPAQMAAHVQRLLENTP